MSKKYTILLFSLFILHIGFSQIAVQLTANVATVSAVNDVVEFNLSVQNISNDILYEYEVVGSTFALSLQYVSGDTNGDTFVNANETWLYNASYTLTQTDINNNGIPTIGSGFVYYEVSIQTFFNGNIQNDTYAIEIDIILLDSDGDGVSDTDEIIDATNPNDGCDFIVSSITQQQSAAWMDADCDNDGVTNEMEFFTTQNHDTDGDNVIDILDIDDDNDGIMTLSELKTDSDGDNLADYLDQDSDNDLIPDNVEMQTTNNFVLPSGNVNQEGLDTSYSLGDSANLLDSDGDNIFDIIDTDSDNDSILDSTESGLSSSSDDIDNDGLNDGADANLSGYGTPNGMINNPANDLTNSDPTSNDVDYREVSCIPIGTPYNVSVCSDMYLNIDLETITSGENNTFSWFATDNPNVTGETVIAVTGTIITDTLYNVDYSGQIVIYTVTPTSFDGCVGDSFTISVTVDVPPIGVDYSISVNSGDTLSVVLPNLVNVDSTFFWSAQDNINVLGESLVTTDGGVINDTLENYSTVAQIVIYEVTPVTFNNCQGYPFNITVTVNPTCFMPTNFTFAYIYADAAALNWDAGGIEAVWQLRFEGNVIDITSPYYDFTNLTSDTTYTYEVRSVCSVGNYSEWFVGTFQTSIIPPACGGTFSDTGGINGNYQNNEDRITTILPENSGEFVTVTFTSFQTEAGYDYLQIYNGDSVNGDLLDTIGGNSIAMPVSYTSTDVTGALTFKFHSDTSQTGSGWIADVTCALPPTCLPVTQITINSISEFMVAITFQDNNSPNPSEWEIEYGLSDFTQGNGTTIVSPSQNLSIDNLTPSTAYDVYVRVNCGNGDYSTWTMLTFETDVAPCNVPTGNQQQVFEASVNPTIADIDVQSSVQGEIVLIFDVNDCNATPLDLTTLLSNGVTYYAFQGACCGDSLAIQVELNTPVTSYPYNVAQIPFQIYGQPLPNTMNMDDAFTDLIPLTFNFNYFGFNYNQLSIGTNSVISFEASDAGLFCDWDINTNNTIPSSQTIDNAILGAYQDYDNRGGMAGTQGYGFIGTAPFRKFVVFFDDVELYNTSYCAGIRSTNQMVLYESYDYIDVQVQDRNVCTAWNEGNAIIGIQNMGGTEAYFPTNRNVGDWEAHNEGYRFKPEYNVPDFQFIICDTNVDGVEIFDLTSVISEFNVSAGSVLNFYETLADAEAFTNPISINYTNTSNAQTIYLRIDDNLDGLSIKRILLATIDCNADYDLDTVPTLDEDLNNNGNYGDDDTDGDAIPDFIDEDDDGDFVLTTVEAVVTTNKDTLVYLDTDGDQIPNYLDNDDDGDGVLTINEDYDGDMNPSNDDTNNDMIADYLQQSVALGVDEVFLNEFTIYPNPALDVLIVDFKNLKNEVTIKIFSLQGQEVYVKSAITDNTAQINISNLSSGVYFVNVLEENKVSVQKFIKK